MQAKILILGGTQFVGRVFLEALLVTHPNAQITLFNRGKTNTHLFPECEKIIGDRYTDDILKITNKYWDFIIDFSCYLPSSLSQLLPELKAKVGRYIFVSTVAVYNLEKAAKMDVDIDEDFELLPYTSEMEDSKLLQYYGNKKAECERILMADKSLDSIILRPSIIYGKYNHYERIYYWLYRMKNHSEAILPDNGNLKQSLTFVDDFSQMLLAAMKVKEHNTVYNANSFEPDSLLGILENIKELYPNNTHLVPVSASDYLVENDKMKYRIPLFSIGSNKRFTNKRIREDFGITFHSIKESFKKNIEYYEAISKNDEGNIGLKLHHEKAILFGYFLDQDEFRSAEKLLAENCEYDIGSEILIGPKAICNSYESNMIEGRNKMDVLEWGKSKIEALGNNEFYVHFTDYLTHQSCSYTHRCKQKITLDDNALIIKIKHINDDDENKRLGAFYRSVGIPTKL